MQKKLIALAIAGFAAAPAFAQVTVYGVADVTLENVRAAGVTNDGVPATTEANRPARNRVTSNSSLLGFRGTEDLGNGLNAIFQFETGVNADSAISSTTAPTQTLGIFNRDTFVGLQSASMGTIKLGLNSNPYRRLGAAYDFNPGATGIPFNGAIFGAIDNIQTGFDNRLNNSVAYDSPVMSGLQIRAIYGADENRSVLGAATPVKDTTFGLGVDYNLGGLNVGFATERRNDSAPAGFGAGADNKAQGNRIGAKYTFGTTTVGVLYDQYKLTSNTAGTQFAAGDDLERTAFGVQLAHVVGANQFIAQVSVASDLEFDGVKDNGTGAKMYSLAWNHSLSKRTMVKTYFSVIRNDQGAAYDFYTAPVGLGTGNATSYGADPKGVGVGLRHSF